MKKLITLILCLCFANFINAQKLNLNLVKELIQANLFDKRWDEYMLEGYGFEKLENMSDERTSTYGRTYNNDYNSTIIIKVMNTKDISNAIVIYLGKNFNIRDVKDDLLSRGYDYNGSNKYGGIVYKKNKSTYVISKKPNEIGATQIIVLTVS